MAKIVATVTFESDEGDQSEYMEVREVTDDTFLSRDFTEAALEAATAVYRDVRDRY